MKLIKIDVHMSKSCIMTLIRQVDELLSKEFIKKSLKSVRCISIINP